MELPPSNPSKLEEEIQRLGDFTDLSKHKDHDIHPDVLLGMEGVHKPTSSASRGARKSSTTGLAGILRREGNVENDIPLPPGSPPQKPRKHYTAAGSSSTGGTTVGKPMTLQERKAWEKLIAIAGNRKDGAVIATKISQIQNYKNLFPSLTVEKINADTVTVEQLDLILQGIENQLAQPHVRDTGKLQFMLLCKTFQKCNTYFGLGMKVDSLMDVADIRYKYIEPDWLELLCKYNLLVSSRVELRVAQKFWETIGLSRGVDEGHIILKQNMKKQYVDDPYFQGL